MTIKPPPPFVSGGLPGLGHTLEFNNQQDLLMRRGYTEHGDVFAIKLAGKPVAIVTGATWNKLFYTETDKKLNITDVYAFIKAAFGEVIFTAPHDVYMNQRPILQAIFTKTKMAEYAQAMQFEVQHWLDGLGESGEMNIVQEMLSLTQFVAGHAFIGPDFASELPDHFWQDYDAISKSIDPILPPNWPFPKYLRRDRAKVRIKDALLPIITRRRQNPEKYNDLITQLFEVPQKDGSFLDDDQIITLFMGLLFAGHETTAGQAAWTIIQLLQNPDYLAQVQEEINSLVPLGKTIDGELLRQMQQVYWAVEETSRMRPSAPMQIRLVEEPLDIGEYTVPTGWLIQVNSANTHYQTEVFTEPYEYDPERFSPERNEARNSFNLVSFGGGIHKCTGMNFAKNEMAVITTLLFQQYDLELATQGTRVKMGAGAARPTDTIVRYTRKEKLSTETFNQMADQAA